MSEDIHETPGTTPNFKTELARQLKKLVAEAIVDENPVGIIILEDAFKGDDELKTNLAQLCKSKSIELWTA